MRFTVSFQEATKVYSVVKELKKIKQALGPLLQWPHTGPAAAGAYRPPKTADPRSHSHGIKTRSLHKNELSVPGKSRNLNSS
jgi:hypothetical protein